jgi:hypothetical protein
MYKQGGTMKNFSKILIFMFIFSLVAGVCFAKDEEFLSQNAVKNTVQVKNFHSFYFKTKIGDWKKVPDYAKKLRDLQSLGAHFKESDVLERQSLEEPNKFIYTLAPNTRVKIKDSVPAVPAVYGYKANASKSFHAVDEKILMTKKVIKQVDAGEKPLIVRVKPYKDVKITKKTESKWRYINRKK